jgi:hypothetical protein
VTDTSKTALRTQQSKRMLLLCRCSEAINGPWRRQLKKREARLRCGKAALQGNCI